jgi:hypothetical protein
MRLIVICIFWNVIGDLVSSSFAWELEKFLVVLGSPLKFRSGPRPLNRLSLFYRDTVY